MSDETLVDPTQDDGPLEAAVDDVVGLQIDRFIVIERLGAGGMGEVFAAYDRKLDRKVALKVLHAERAPSEAAQSRLVREARALARLSHPNVVTVFDAGRHDEQVFIAMEFVQGRTLREWLGEPDRTWPEVVRVFIELSKGLGALHELDLVHRDVKPDNVIINARGRPRLIDFGLAKETTNSEQRLSGDELLEEELDDEDAVWSESAPHFTRTGALVGTPRYMSPEQFQSIPLGPSSDQFSLCVALFEALYGVTPFNDDSITARATAVVIGEIRKPASKDKVPSELYDILTRGLRSSPQARWTSMEELEHMLSSVLASHDPEFNDPKEAARRRKILLVLMVLMLLIPGGFAFSIATGRVALNPLTLAASDVFSGLGFVAALSVTHSQWSRSRMGRRLAGITGLFAATFVGQGVVGWAVDRPPLHSIYADLVSFTLIALFAAPALDRVLFPIAAIGGAMTLAAIAAPEHALICLNAALLLSAITGVIVVPRRTKLRWVTLAASSTGVTSTRTRTRR